MLLALAVVAGAELWLQRQAAAELRGELVLLRDERTRLGHLRADNEKLVAAQPPAAELERLRADRAAAVQLRAEIERLKRGVEARENALKPSPRPATSPPDDPEPAPVVQVLRAGKWKNAGRATPMAALETALWAGSSGHIDELTDLLMFDDSTLKVAQAMFDGLPATNQKEYGSTFRMVAALMAKDMPAGDVHVTVAKSLDPDPVSAQLEAELHDNKSGQTEKAHFEFQKNENNWGLWLPKEAVENLAAQFPATVAK